MSDSANSSSSFTSCSIKSGEFVDIHGRDLIVKIEKSGEILVPLDQMKQTGFNIYKKKQFNKLHVSDAAFNDEFHCFMLEAAKNFMLLNEIRFDENEILSTIANLAMGCYFETCYFVPVICLEQEQTVIYDKNNSCKKALLSLNKQPEDGAGDPTVTSTSKPHKNGFLTQENLANHCASPNSDTSSEISYQRPKQNEKLPILPLNIGPCIVRVVNFVKNKERMAWVYDKNAENTFRMIKNEIIDSNPSSLPFVPFKSAECNFIYLIEDDGEWHRCKVIKFRPLKVFLVDCGRIVESNFIKMAPERVRRLPCLANRISYKNSSIPVEEGDEIRVLVTVKYETGTYGAQVKENLNKSGEISVNGAEKVKISSKIEQKESSQQCCQLGQEVPKPTTSYFEAPTQSCQLEHGIRVTIANEKNGHFGLRTPEAALQMVKISHTIANLENLEFLADAPKIGQLVLSPRHDDAKNVSCARAVVLGVDDDIAEVEFIDFFSVELVKATTLRQIPKLVAEMGLAYIPTPKIKGIEEFSDEMRVFLRQKIAEMKRYNVIWQHGEFDLVDTTSLPLSKQLLDLGRGEKVGEKRVMLADLAAFRPNLGLGSYLCTERKSLDCVYFIPNDVFNEKFDIVTRQKSELDEMPNYKPILGEVCFGLFEGLFYRCVVKKEIGSGFGVNFIDFGNDAVMEMKDLRKIDESASKEPILAILCKFIDYGDNEKVIKDNLQLEEIYDVKLTKFNGDKYEIVIPTIYDSFF